MIDGRTQLLIERKTNSKFTVFFKLPDYELRQYQKCVYVDQINDSPAVAVSDIPFILSFTSLSATRPSLLSKNPRLHHTLVPVCQGQASWAPGMTRTSQNVHIDQGCWNPGS